MTRQPSPAVVAAEEEEEDAAHGLYASSALLVASAPALEPSSLASRDTQRSGFDPEQRSLPPSSSSSSSSRPSDGADLPPGQLSLSSVSASQRSGRGSAAPPASDASSLHSGPQTQRASLQEPSSPPQHRLPPNQSAQAPPSPLDPPSLPTSPAPLEGVTRERLRLLRHQAMLMCHRMKLPIDNAASALDEVLRSVREGERTTIASLVKRVAGRLLALKRSTQAGKGPG